MPTVTYCGRSWSTRNIDPTHRDFIRHETREVTSAWLDRFGSRLGDDFVIEGWSAEEAVTEDRGGDGIPDEGWTRKDIQKWLEGYDVAPKGYATKSTLLEIVATVMSPDGVAETEEMAAEAAESEESTESE